MKKYFKTTMADATDIKVDVYYHKGGFNCFTCEPERRGIYFSISPVKRDGIWESYTAFSGSKICVKELKRKSDKSLNEVISKIEPIIEEVVRMYENGFQRDALIKVLTECNSLDLYL